MSTTALLKFCWVILLTISAIVTVAVLWPGKGPGLGRRPPSNRLLRVVRRCLTRGPGARPVGGAAIGTSHLHRPGDHGGDESRRSPVGHPRRA